MRVKVGVSNHLVPVVMVPRNRDPLHLTIPLHHHIRVDHRHLIAPQKQCPPPLSVALKAHNTVDKPKLIGYIVIIHFEVVSVRQRPAEESEVNILLKVRRPNLLCRRNPQDLVTLGRDHVERLLVVARRYDQVGRHTVPLEDRRLDRPSCGLGMLPDLSSCTTYGGQP